MSVVNQLKKLDRELARKRRKTEQAHARGLLRAGLHLQRESQKIVPIDTATLKRSARTEQEGMGFDIEVLISYNTDYAIYVHENLSAAHAEGKTAKFLEIPARTEQNEMMRIYREALSKGR